MTVCDNAFNGCSLGRINGWADDESIPRRGLNESLYGSDSLNHDCYVIVCRQQSGVNQRMIEWVTGVELYIATYSGLRRSGYYLMIGNITHATLVM